MGSTEPVYDLTAILRWSEGIIGSCKVLTKDLRFHDRTAVLQLHTPKELCHLKIHRQASYWEAEVHGYEQWAAVFNAFAPRLLAVHDTEPLALLVSDLAGEVLDNIQLSTDKEQKAWHSAGRALRQLHEYSRGEFFGPCRRNGDSAGRPVTSGETFIAVEFEHLLETGRRLDLLSQREFAVIQAAQDQTSIFAHEPPVPCHRDYGPANWVISPNGEWSGVIDFEFAQWDVRVTDFSRYPNWEWMTRPELLEAFFEGYGRSLTAEEEEQCFITRTLYALGAVVWGNEHAFHGFEAEGHQALKQLGELAGID